MRRGARVCQQVDCKNATYGRLSIDVATYNC